MPKYSKLNIDVKNVKAPSVLAGLLLDKCISVKCKNINGSEVELNSLLFFETNIFDSWYLGIYLNEYIVQNRITKKPNSEIKNKIIFLFDIDFFFL